ncbi:hypothetical protein HanIR_Chr14g0688661 [Helianthus annuus]|nr:hypothetical protein HanIR_Chr14g0688661 [Helianthus annuus]
MVAGGTELTGNTKNSPEFEETTPELHWTHCSDNRSRSFSLIISQSYSCVTYKKSQRNHC